MTKKATRRSFIKKTSGTLAAATLATPFINFSAKAKSEKVIRGAMALGQFSAIDPHTANEHTGYSVVAAMFGSLVRTPPGGSTADPAALEGDLAESWESSNDLTEWTFNLRKNIQWQKGFGEFTADDVAFSVNRIKDPKTGSAWSKRFANINAQVIDRYTVKLTSPKPDPLFLTKVFDWQTGNIACKKAAEKMGDKFSINPVGTGPFELKEYRPGDRVILTPFKDYYRWKNGDIERTNVDAVEIVLYGDVTSRDAAVWGGEAHLMQAATGFKARAALADRSGLNTWKQWPPAPSIVRCNFKIPPLDDIRVRKAIAHAINPQEGAKILAQGTDHILPLTAPYSSDANFGIYGGLNLSEAVYPYDPEKSGRLLAEAGHSKGIDLGDVYSGPWGIWVSVYEILQQQLAQVKIKFNLKPLEAPNFFKLSRGGSNPLPIYMASRFPDANFYLDEFLHSKNAPGQNMGNFKNDKFDSLVDSAWIETDPAARVKMLNEAQMIALEEAAGMPFVGLFAMQIASPKVDMGYPGGDPAKTGLARVWNQWHKISEGIRWRG